MRIWCIKIGTAEVYHDMIFLKSKFTFNLSLFTTTRFFV
jgi:hypothetical protein